MTGYLYYDRPAGISVISTSRTYTLHGDTTTHMLYGVYVVCEEEAYHALSPANGHSKAHRPDLKQVKTGLIADGNGIPLEVQSPDGNMSDST